MKKAFIIIFALVACCYSKAQVKTSIFPDGNAFKEIPFLNQIHKEEIPLYEMPAFNVDSVLKYEADLDEKGVGRPYRFGYTFDTDYGMEHGKWIELEDKNIWSIRFSSESAYTLNFRFADLKLSAGAEMYVYNTVGTVVIGPYTYKNNAIEEFRSIGSDLINGEEVIIQIIEPKETKQTSSVKIVKVVHGFRDYYKDILPNKDEKGDRFQALSCHNDVMCYPDFENYSRGVARLMEDDWAFCSGALLNNTMGTNRPYLLTALHCADKNGNGAMDNMDKALLSNWQFTFNYKKVCNSNSVVSYVSNTYAGCHFRSTWQPTDFLLVEIKDAITDPNIRFLGWDIATGYPYAPIGIHHPAGAPMKISFDWHTAYSNDDDIDWTEGPDSPEYSHLEVGFDNGTTEGGSSGSPLFYHEEGDPEYRVVGQLHGGSAGCAPVTMYYGRIGRSWSMGSTKELRLKEWLAPYNTAAIITNSTGPCQSITFENKTLTEDERIVCKNITLQNITINSGATLLLQASESITLGPNVIVKTGGTLITEGRLLMNSGYKVEAGASFIVK